MDDDGGEPTGAVAVPFDETVPADEMVSSDETVPDQMVSDAGSAGVGFAPEVVARLRAYVYLLVDPRTGRPFRVGRGKGDRCFRDLATLRAGTGDDADRVRAVEASGRKVRIDILRHGLGGVEAKLVEAVANDALGLTPARPGDGGGQRVGADRLASVLARPARFKRSHPVVLLRLAADGDDPRTQRWRIGRRWADPTDLRAPRWAVAVDDDLVRGVYRIDGWDPTGAPTDPATRYTLRGDPDPELEKRYRGRSVAAYRGAGAQPPVTYVWCGPHWVNRPR